MEGPGKSGRLEGWRAWGGRLEGWRGDTAGKARGLELKGPGMVGGAGQIRKVGRLEVHLSPEHVTLNQWWSELYTPTQGLFWRNFSSRSKNGKR